MGFLLSPGVHVTEIDLTTIVPAVATSSGAIAGVFRWGPVGERVFIDSENALVSRFGKPTNFNAETWFTGANFLGYTNALYVSRAANTTGSTPTGSFTAVTANTVLTANGATTNYAIGMYVTQTGNSSVVLNVGKTNYITAVNSTCITLAKPAIANGTVQLYFGHPETTYSAVAMPAGAVVTNLVNQIVKNENDYLVHANNFDIDAPVMYVARCPGDLGNSLRISICDTANSFQSNVNVLGTATFTIGSNTMTIEMSSAANGYANTSAVTVAQSFAVGDQLLAGNSVVGQQFLQICLANTANALSYYSVSNTYLGPNGTYSTANTLVTVQLQTPYRLHTNYSSNTVTRYWEFFNAFGKAPGQSDYIRFNGNTSANDELHICVVDDGGAITGVPGTILEVYNGVSRATDAKNNDGSTNYYVNVINDGSQWVWWANDRTTAPSANADNVTSATSTAPGDYYFTLGSDGYDEANNSAFSIIGSAYDLFASKEDVDISLVMQGRPLGGTTVVNGRTVTNFQTANYIIDNIAGLRTDCVAFISPDKSTVVNNKGNEALTLAAWRGACHDSSYAVMDSGYKYQYDRYNDIYRWIPLNGDIAGLCARCDQTNDAWWSPAGFNRGQIKNLVKLAFNPRQAERDILYPAGVNPVVTFPGQGTVLFGDKTMQSKPSAFDRINVRRLFIVLEKAISLAARYSLFEFNDSFTRAQFKNLVTPYLRNVQGRRGITDFLVVCDDTNNTPQVIDSNQFVGDIYIKPARSINFIQLNFVAVGTGVQFSEVVGKFG